MTFSIKSHEINSRVCKEYKTEREARGPNISERKVRRSNILEREAWRSNQIPSWPKFWIKKSQNIFKNCLKAYWTIFSLKVLSTLNFLAYFLNSHHGWEGILVLCEKWLSKFSSNLYVLRPPESEKVVFTKVSVCLSVVGRILDNSR